MEGKDSKIVGYILLGLGIGIILFSAYSAFSVFTGSSKPISIFNSESIQIDLSNMVEQGTEASATSAAPNIELLDANIINTSLNSSFHLLLMFFFVTVGAKIATIGTYLIRTIKVNFKGETANSNG